jgi:lipoprotein-anchoring transpeptidase ErfK/SrfK
MFKFLPLLLIAVVIAVIFSGNPLQNSPAPAQTSVASATVSDDGACVDSKTLSEATGLFDSGATLAYYDNQQVAYPGSQLAQISNDKNSAVLGAVDSAGKEKWIEVDLAKQQLTAWEGNDIYLQYPISSGLYDPTPPGTYSIYWKIRYIRMKGGDKTKRDFYDLPNVPDTMFFYQGFGIHGAYWHHNFGHPMSHGCVNEPLDKAHQLFEWAGPRINPDQSSVRASADNPGSRVFIH